MGKRPGFKLPFPAGTVVSIQTYKGHNPDDKKMDMYAQGWPDNSAVVAAAAGVVHEHFDPGGIEINHGKGWFTTYMHMSERAPIGHRVRQGAWVGHAGSVGTGAKHLHHEQLDARNNNATDADTGDMVNPVIQGRGPFVLRPGHPILMTSTNGRATSPKPGKPVTIYSPFPYRAKPGHVIGLLSGPARYHGGATPAEQRLVFIVTTVLHGIGYPIEPTTQYTDAVAVQVKRFQLRNGTKRATGQVGLWTWNKLRAAWVAHKKATRK